MGRRGGGRTSRWEDKQVVLIVGCNRKLFSSPLLRMNVTGHMILLILYIR